MVSVKMTDFLPLNDLMPTGGAPYVILSGVADYHSQRMEMFFLEEYSGEY